jgi:hypothetical protein
MGIHISSKVLKPAVGALGIAFLIGAPIGACGHHPTRLQNQLSVGPLSTHFEVANTVK